MEKHELNRVSIFNISICSTGTENEALEYARSCHAAGTSNNWQKYEWSQCEDYKQFAPVKCAEHSERNHYIFFC